MRDCVMETWEWLPLIGRCPTSLPKHLSDLATYTKPMPTLPDTHTRFTTEFLIFVSLLWTMCSCPGMSRSAAADWKQTGHDTDVATCLPP